MGPSERKHLGRSCPICNGSGWVCEIHPDQPWKHDGRGGAGSRCVCNPRGEVPWAKVYATNEERPDDQPLH